jgi:hypothetical protein
MKIRIVQEKLWKCGSIRTISGDSIPVASSAILILKEARLLRATKRKVLQRNLLFGRSLEI